MASSIAARALLVAGLVTVFIGGGAYAATHVGEAAPEAAPAAVAPSTTRPASAPVATSAAPSPSGGSALAVLATLPIKGRAPMTGYVRTARFGAAWLDVDRNGCDTRDDVLRRDLDDVTGSRCTVRAGVLHDPYTRSTIEFRRGAATSTAVQIDHVVALGDAWQTGAQRLTQAQRIALANDPINLFAVDGRTNAQKRDSDAASWLPPNKAFRCTYVAHQVGVKRAYGLWVTAAEKAAMERVLTACPTAAAPISTVSRLEDDRPGAGGSTHPSPAHPSAPTGGAKTSEAVVHPGSYCSPAGAEGRSESGAAMTCRTSSTDSRTRWRTSS